MKKIILVSALLLTGCTVDSNVQPELLTLLKVSVTNIDASCTIDTNESIISRGLNR